MPTPNLSDNLLEFTFTTEEYRAARFLNPMQVAFLHTIRAQKMKLRATTPVPNSSDLDRAYLADQIQLQGEIDMLTELLDHHAAAIKELSNPNKINEDPDKVMSGLDQRAAELVHRQT